MPELSADEISQFKQHPSAWAFFKAQRPSYRRAVIRTVFNVKQAATSQRRLLRLIEAAGKGQRW